MTSSYFQVLSNDAIMIETRLPKYPIDEPPLKARMSIYHVGYKYTSHQICLFLLLNQVIQETLSIFNLTCISFHLKTLESYSKLIILYNLLEMINSRTT